VQLFVYNESRDVAHAEKSAASVVIVVDRLGRPPSRSAKENHADKLTFGRVSVNSTSFQLQFNGIQINWSGIPFKYQFQLRGIPFKYPFQLRGIPFKIQLHGIPFEFQLQLHGILLHSNSKEFTSIRVEFHSMEWYWIDYRKE
jgi:hypothetical protein